MKQKILFLYLNTGGGHLAPARVLKEAMEQQYGDGVHIELYSGFHKRQVLARLFFETGYRIASAFVPGMYSLTYDWTNHPFWQKYYRYVASRRTAHYLKKYLEENGITKVVSFHFGLTPGAVSAISRTRRYIPLVTVVTDPFTAHSSWFIEREGRFIVFSPALREQARKLYHMDESQICVMPFLLNKKFLISAGPDQINEYKRARGLPADKKILLIAGGGEGLQGTIPIVHECIRQKLDCAVVVVCGRDAATKKVLELLRLATPKFSLTVFGFVPFMHELLKSADCVISKAGASTVMEIAACRKPVIISKYIHGQELGNVHFVLENRIGWFIQNPRAIVAKVRKLFTDVEYAAAISENIAGLPDNSDISQFTEFIYTL